MSYKIGGGKPQVLWNLKQNFNLVIVALEINPMKTPGYVHKREMECSFQPHYTCKKTPRSNSKIHEQ